MIFFLDVARSAGPRDSYLSCSNLARYNGFSSLSKTLLDFLKALALLPVYPVLHAALHSDLDIAPLLELVRSRDFQNRSVKQVFGYFSIIFLWLWLLKF